MAGLDDLVAMGKKYLPQPLVLLLSHLIFALWAAGWIGLTAILFSTRAVIWNGVVIQGFSRSEICGDVWTTHMIWLGAVALCVLIALAKYKETSDVVGTIVSAIAFWLTLIGIQVVPFYCYNKTQGTFIFLSILRVIIDVPLVLIYGVWCKSELQTIGTVLPTVG